MPKRLVRSLLAALILLTSIILAACGPAFTPLPYADDFSNPDSGWKTVDDPAVKIDYQDGALHFNILELDTLAWSVPKDKRFGDFVLDVDASQIAGPNDNSYGVIFRYVDDRNFYRFDISGDGYFAVFKYKDGTWAKVQDYTETAVVKQATSTNHLQVIAQGNQFTVNVNDQPVTTFSDSDFPNGNVGVTAGSLFDNANVHIVFDNLTVREVNP
jgi:hypothetical protein